MRPMTVVKVFGVMALASVMILAAAGIAAAESKVITIPAVSFSAQGGGEAAKTEGRQAATEFAEGYVHFWYTKGHWLEWTVEGAKAGSYEVTLQYTAKQGAVRGLAVNGAAAKGLESAVLPRTERWNAWNTFTLPAKVTLTEGRNVLRLTCMDAASAWLNTITLTGQGAEPMVLQAARFSGQGGGAVQVLTPPLLGYVRKCSAKDQWLEWTIEKAAAGTYSVALHYATYDPANATELRVNGEPVAALESFRMASTGDDTNWSQARLPATVTLKEGRNVLRLTRKAGELDLSAIVLTSPPTAAEPAVAPPAYEPLPAVKIDPAPLGPPLAAVDAAKALKQGQTVTLGGRQVLVRQIEALPYVENGFSKRFSFENYDNPRLKQIREMYRLDEVVAAGKDEYEKQLLLMEWIYNRWDFGHAKERYNLKDPFEILEFAGREHKFQCMHSAAVMQAVVNSMGWVARQMAIPQHTFNEIWSNQHRRWIMFDATSNYIPQKAGQPLNTFELRQSLLYDAGKDTFSIKMAGGQITSKPKSVSYGQRLLFVGYIPNTDSLVRGPDYGKMFITKDKLCEGKKWHTRECPADPAVEPYFPINQAALTLAAEGDKLAVALGTMTPNFKEFRVRLDGGAWKPLQGTTYPWSLHEGSNLLEAVSVNKFEVPGPASTVVVEVGK